MGADGSPCEQYMNASEDSRVGDLPQELRRGVKVV
jgi:hypothetical protein